MLAHFYWVLMSERIFRIREPTITTRQLRARQLRPGNCTPTIARTTFVRTTFVRTTFARTTFVRNTKYAQSDGTEYFSNTFSRIC